MFDLKKCEYIQETSDDFDITKINQIRTYGYGENADYKSICNPKRFIEPIGDYPKIPELYLAITMKGVEFMINHDNDIISTEINRKQNRTFGWIVALTFITALIGALQLFADCYCK